MISGLLFYAGAALLVCAAWHLVPALWAASNVVLIKWEPRHDDVQTALHMERALTRFRSGARAATSARETPDGIEFVDHNGVVVARLEGVLRPSNPAVPARFRTLCRTAPLSQKL